MVVYLYNIVSSIQFQVVAKIICSSKLYASEFS